jgi:Mn2+/Fe2+ NRAMP family transporter
VSLYGMSWLEAIAATVGTFVYVVVCCLVTEFFVSRPPATEETQHVSTPDQPKQLVGQPAAVVASSS